MRTTAGSTCAVCSRSSRESRKIQNETSFNLDSGIRESVKSIPKSKFKIRRATRKDIDTLVSHRRRMWQDILRQEREKSGTKDRVYRKWLSDVMSRGKFVGFLAVADGGRIVGSGVIWLRETSPKPWSSRLEEPYLLSMYTEPELRGKGVATKIVKEAMKWSKKKGYKQFRLNASKMGRRVYADLGWERTWEMRVKF